MEKVMKKGSVALGGIVAFIMIIIACFCIRNSALSYDYKAEFNTVAEMLTYEGELVEGDYLKTAGFYSIGDGGGATYIVCKSSKCAADGYGVLELFNNTLTAKLVIENDTVDVVQYGAVGDGVASDEKALKAAITSGAGTINFKYGEYRCGNQLLIYNVGDFTINGNNSSIVVDNDYRDGLKGSEHFIIISGSETKHIQNININELKIQAKCTGESISQKKFSNLLTIMYADNIVIDKCSFDMPEMVTEENFAQYNENNVKPGYNLLDLYTGWNNVTVKNSTFMNRSNAYAGCCIQIRDIWKNSAAGADIYENTMYSNAKDEIIAIFSSEGGASTVNDVLIHDNIIVADKNIYGRDICMTVGYDKSQECNNIQIYENNITGVTRWATFTLGDALTNSVIRDNKITVKTESDNLGVFRATVSNPENGITNKVYGNEIIIEEYNGKKTGVIFAGVCNFYDNTVLANEKVYSFFEGSGLFTHNEITANKDVDCIAENVAYVKDNTVDIKGKLTSFGFQFPTISLNKKLEIENNTLTLASLPNYLFTFNGAKLNENDVIIKNNKLITPQDVEQKRLLYVQLSDSSPQDIYLLDNKFGECSQVVQWGNATGVTHNIIYELIDTSEDQNSESSESSENSEASSETTFENTGTETSSENHIETDTQAGTENLGLENVSNSVENTQQQENINASNKIDNTVYTGDTLDDKILILLSCFGLLGLLGFLGFCRSFSNFK